MSNIANVLSAEIWEHIADFLGSMTLSHVSRRLWELLEKQHIWFVQSLTTTSDKMAWLKPAASKVRTLNMRWCLMSQRSSIGAFIKDLHPFTSIHALALQVFSCSMALQDLHDIGLLAAMPLLSTLSLTLMSCRLNDLGIAALLPLREAPCLQHLQLILPHNMLHHKGIQILADLLTDMQHLGNLLLDISFNAFQDFQLFPLAALKEVPNLHALTLRLGALRLGDVGIRAIMPLKYSQSLRRLTLELQSCGIGPEGAQLLSEFRNSSSLTNLTMDLQDNNLGWGGAVALTSLGQTPKLEHLTLGLRGNQLLDFGAYALTSLAEGTSLRSLQLNVSYNGFTQTGKQALQALERSTSLQRCSLQY